MKKYDVESNIDIEHLQALCQLAIVEHKTLAELQGLSSQDLEAVYDSGLIKYQAGSPEQAIVDFTYLVMHQPWDRRFHMALASTFQWLGEYQHALIFYGYALVMDACDPGATFRIGQCLLNLGEEAAAIDALRTAITQSYSQPEYHDICVQAQALLDAINHS